MLLPEVVFEFIAEVVLEGKILDDALEEAALPLLPDPMRQVEQHALREPREEVVSMGRGEGRGNNWSVSAERRRAKQGMVWKGGEAKARVL